MGETQALNEGRQKETKKQIKTRGTDCPGEALVLGHVGNVERLHGVLDILSIHVVNLADITVPAETHDIVMTTELQGHKGNTKPKRTRREQRDQSVVM